ncbi:MAG TPA: hypothetical protein VKA45_07030 [Gaiellaceae bacterium]|nr:hypothetical protein [Gaiellaceae bacterium]
MDGERPGLAEAVVVWAFYGLMLAAVVTTYSRIDPVELYHVDETGLRGGLGRALVAVDFPIALVAVPLALLAALRLGTRLALVAAVVASVLCWAVAVPGVVDQGDLDARTVNVISAIGVAIALALTVVAVVKTGVGSAKRRLPGDPVRIVIAAALLLVGLPWLFAEVGAYIGHVALLGDVFLSNELRPTSDNPLHRVVHLGEHHGGYGVYLAVTALLLSRVLPRLRGGWRTFFTFYLSLMLLYGLALVAEDGWGEQVVARDWASWTIPSVLEPGPTIAWGVLLVSAVALCLVWLRSGRERARPS